MRTLSMLAVALLGSALTFAQESAESLIRKNFTVAPGGKLTIRADRGSITVKTVAADQVTVEITREPGRGASADILQRHQVNFTQQGNDVQIKAEMTGAKSWVGNRNNLRVKYEIFVPTKFNVDLKSSGGSVSVTDLEGEAKSETSGGSLKFGQINGPIFGHTSGGSIEVNSCSRDIHVSTSGGGIRVGDVGGKVNAKTSGGSIVVGNVKGSVDAETSGGGITVESALGPVRAHTSGGSIRASLTEQPTGDCSFETSGGGIEVKMADKVAVDLDARTSGGSVSSEIPVMVQGVMKRNEMRSKLNGGGPKLTLATSGGSIKIRKL